MHQEMNGREKIWVVYMDRTWHPGIKGAYM